MSQFSCLCCMSNSCPHVMHVKRSSAGIYPELHHDVQQAIAIQRQMDLFEKSQRKTMVVKSESISNKKLLLLGRAI